MNKIIPESTFVEPVARDRVVNSKICIVTGELAGPFFNGGIGTTNRALALVLRTLGYRVDILYTNVGEGRPFCIRGEFPEHVAEYQKAGIQLKCIDHMGHQYDWPARSYLALQYLLHHRYDVVFFDDMDGTAYYPLLARRTGRVELRGTKMCVTTHSATQWITDLNQTHMNFDSLRLIEMERRSIELADAVKAPSVYILRKYRSYGWAVPDNSIVLPNFVSVEHVTPPPSKHIDVDELVFFGRLETRKGLWMFCRALDRVKYKLGNRVVTFLGKSAPEIAETLLRHSATWPFEIRLLTNFDREQALAYLKREGRLAVMPSPEDNSPSAILECLEEGIPFIACGGSGGEELIDENDRQFTLFEPSVEALCAKLVDTFANGAVSARPSFNHADLHRRFAKWIQDLNVVDQKTARSVDHVEAPNPILVVLIPTDFDVNQAIGELRLTARAFDGKLHLQVLAGRAAELEARLAGESLPVNVVRMNEFSKLAQSLATGKSTVVGVCHITQLLSPAWVERAQTCFALRPDLSALTGMVGAKKEFDARVREPYVSAANGSHRVHRYLTGASPPLFSLLQESNGGYALMRSESLGKLGGLTPVDERYGREKRMEDWIHEILVTLHLSGERFELVPDQLLEQVAREPIFEVFLIERFMRSLSTKASVLGTDQSALARLAIDAGLERVRTASHERYLREIEERTGRKVIHLPAYAPWEEQARQLATVAHANGQIELAVDLCAGIAIEDDALNLAKLSEYVRAVAEGEIVNLVESLAADHRMLNLSSDFTLWGAWDARKIEMRANPARVGLSAILLPSLDLSKVSYFTCTIEVPDEAAPSVRFRIELSAPDKRRRWSADKVVEGGAESVWEFECPAELRDECSILLGVEMIEWDGPSGVIARWVNPRFIQRQAK